MKYRRGIRVRRGYARRRITLAFGTSALCAAFLLPISIPYGSDIPFLQVMYKASLNNQESTYVSTGTTGSMHRAPAHHAVQVAASVLPQAATVQNVSCASGEPVHSGLADAASPELRKLAQYEALCGGAVADTISFFTPTPATALQAQSYAQSAIAELREFSQHGIHPLIFLEPTNDQGVLDLSLYQKGAYDTALDSYFAAIHQAGITDTQMGTWVLFPEDNLPEWGNVDPQTYAANVTKTAQFQKKYFPSSHTALMLDSETYSQATSWDGGEYVSLLPYVQGIPKGLIDSFGLQGFPWSPPAGQNNAVLDPVTYLQVDLAAQAATALGTKAIWFNTGTFGVAYTNDPTQRVAITPAQRSAMLSEVVHAATLLRSQGFAVAVHLFAQNKSSTAEAIDWSYWHNTPGDDPATAVLSDFITQLHTQSVELWLFDTTDS